jgi:hypothetical protein
MSTWNQKPNKTYCKYCNTFVATNILRQHESGHRHQNNVKRWLKNEEQKKRFEKKANLNLQKELDRINNAALNSYLVNDVHKAQSTSAYTLAPMNDSYQQMQQQSDQEQQQAFYQQMQQQQSFYQQMQQQAFYQQMQLQYQQQQQGYNIAHTVPTNSQQQYNIPSNFQKKQKQAIDQTEKPQQQILDQQIEEQKSDRVEQNLETESSKQNDESDYYNNPDYFLYQESEEENEEEKEEKDVQSNIIEKEEKEEEQARKKYKKELPEEVHNQIRNEELLADRSGIGQWETVSVRIVEKKEEQEEEEGDGEQQKQTKKKKQKLQEENDYSESDEEHFGSYDFKDTEAYRSLKRKRSAIDSASITNATGGSSTTITKPSITPFKLNLPANTKSIHSSTKL